MADVSWLSGTRWYVPPENLLAYFTDTALRTRRAVADQTLWHLTSAEGSRFEGTCRAQFWSANPGGGVQPMGDPAEMSMNGEVSEDGQVTIVFTPADPEQPQTTGYGFLREVDGRPAMEMQMATGSPALAIHWAYMLPWTGNGQPSAPDPGFPDAALRSDEWRWLQGTSWRAEDAELFPGGASFTVDAYRNGYPWGEGTTADGLPLRLAGSVTPEGTLYLLFSVDGAAAVARRGGMVRDGSSCAMEWRPVGGGEVVGGATQNVEGTAAAG